MNKVIFLKFISAFLLILIIASAIYFAGIDFPFAILFLIPVALYSIQKGVKLYQIFALSLIATCVWIVTYCISTPDKLSYSVLFQGALRFIIYFILSFLLYRLTYQRVELAKKNKELLELNNEKNNILGIAAHDIRNTIGAINSFAELLTENLKTKENLRAEQELSQIIYNASENLLKLVTDLLDISKIESGQIHLDKSFYDYNEFVESRVNLHQIIARKKNINIVLRKAHDLKNIPFDPVYLSEVIDNLISNAIKYSNRDSEIKLIISITEDNFLRTEVIDSGIGISSSELDKLFKTFSTTSNKPTSGEVSSGLGLAIARKVVNLHGGTIGVESIINEGSVFFFTLPLT
jgi:signal transduction histidine kinase